MLQNSDLIALIVLITAMVTFSIGIAALLGLLGILAATRDIFGRKKSALIAAVETRKRRLSIINFFSLFVGGLAIGSLTLNIAYGNGKPRLTDAPHLVVSTLVIAGTVVALETMVILLVFLLQIVLAATPQKSQFLDGEEITKQSVVVLVGMLVSAGLLFVAYRLPDLLLIGSLSFTTQVLVTLITTIASITMILTGLSALIILLVLAISGNAQHRMLPLWAIFSIGIAIGGLLLFIAQYLSNHSPQSAITETTFLLTALHCFPLA